MDTLETKIAGQEVTKTAGPIDSTALQKNASIQQVASIQQITAESIIDTETLLQRYKSEAPFRDIVHQYMRVPWRKKVALSLTKTVSKSRYQKQVHALITNYAQRIHEDEEHAKVMVKDMEELSSIEQEMKKKDGEITEETKAVQNTEREYALIAEEKVANEDATRQAIVEEQRRIEEEKEKALAIAKEKLDARAIVTENVKNILKQSSLLQVSENGTMKFHEEKLVSRLQDIFLDEVISDVETTTGSTGFFSKLVTSYNGLLTHHAEIEDLDELPSVDWHQTVIYSRTKGYRRPQFPYFISGKYQEKGKINVNTAIAIDTSNSMSDNKRLDVAKKTGLALHALMRRIHPENMTSLATFDNKVKERTPEELYNAKVNDYTYTYDALDWLREKLEGNGLGIAYLITDGAPFNRAGPDIHKTVHAATEYAALHNIMLRIFLVDGNIETEDIIRKVGRAAGRNTKIIPVKNYTLASGVIKDIADVIKDMYNIDQF